MLALADDGSWTASYVPATAAVALGITGEEVTVMRAEDGSYWIGDAALSSGGSVTATNGNEYTLTMADGTWTAAYVPLVQQVAVGNSGLSVPFTRHENGTWTAVHPTLGEQPVTSGVQVPLGIEMYYVELLGDGTWRITYVPKMVPVALGISGQSVTVVKAENGTWSLNGAEFASGEGVAAGFGTYTLTLGSGDTWTAAFNEVPTTVTLGTSGDMVTVVMVEDGSYTLGGDPFASGGEVTAGNGNVYQLTLAEGAWSAMFVPMDVEIGGTGLTAMTREDQDGWDVNGARVPKSGTGDITVHGASFHVWQIDGDLFGARFDKAINSDSAGDSDPEADIGLAGDLTQDNRMMLSDDNEDTVANELRTSLTVGGNTFTMADLLGAGSASASGDNFVVSARAEIEKIRGDVAALLGLDTAPPGLTGILTSRWGAVQTEVNKLFGAGKVNLGTTAPGNDDILGEIDDILAALSSGTQFAAATDGDGSGVFKGAALSESAALEAFDANESESRIVFGSTGETRYGAISQKEAGVRHERPDLQGCRRRDGGGAGRSVLVRDDERRGAGVAHPDVGERVLRRGDDGGQRGRDAVQRRHRAGGEVLEQAGVGLGDGSADGGGGSVAVPVRRCRGHHPADGHRLGQQRALGRFRGRGEGTSDLRAACGQPGPPNGCRHLRRAVAGDGGRVRGLGARCLDGRVEHGQRQQPVPSGKLRREPGGRHGTGTARYRRRLGARDHCDERHQLQAGRRQPRGDRIHGRAYSATLSYPVGGRS